MAMIIFMRGFRVDGLAMNINRNRISGLRVGNFLHANPKSATAFEAAAA
jgi:hypothetical protein